jgi:transposase
MASKQCPKCGEEMEHFDDEPDVNIQGGWLCPACDHFIHDSEIDDDLEYSP